MLVSTSSNDPILPSDLGSKLDVVEKQLARLEHPHNIDNAGRTFQKIQGILVGVEVLSLHYHYAEIFTGASAQVLTEMYLGDPVPDPGLTVTWEFRYVQQVPNIYTAAQKAAKTNYIVLDSGVTSAIPGLYTAQLVEMSAPTTDALRGTYGRFEVWLYTNGGYLSYGGVSFVNFISTGFV